MATSIGNLNVKLGLDPTGMSQGIAKASNMLDGFNRTLASKIAGAVVGVGKAAKGLESALSDPLGTLDTLLQKIPYVGAVLALPVQAANALVGVFQEGSKVIEETGPGAAAMKAGASVSAFQTAMHGTRMKAEELISPLFKLNQHVAAAAMGSEEGSRLFDKYGLSADALAKLDVDRRLELIAGRFQALKDPTLQARMAFDLFGKAGYDMLPFLNKGPEAIAEARNMLDATGLRFTDQDFKNVKQAGEFAKQLKNLKDSITIEVTKGVAPFLAEFNQLFADANVGAKGLSEYVKLFGQGFVFAGSVGLAAFKGLTALLPDFNVMLDVSKTYAMNFGSMLLEGFTAAVGALSPLVGRLGDLVNVAKEVNDELRTWKVLREGTDWGAWWNGSNFNNTGKDIQLGQMPNPELDKKFPLAAGAAAATATADKLKEAQERFKKASENFGKVGFGDVWKNAKADYEKFMAGVEQRFQQGGRAMGEINRDSVRAMYGDRIKAYEDAVKGPMEKFQEDFRKLQEVDAMANKFGLMSDKTYALNANKLFKELDSAMPKDQGPKFASAIEADSREAYSANLKFANQEKADDPQKRMMEIMRQQLEVERRNEQNGRQVVEALRNINARGI